MKKILFSVLLLIIVISAFSQIQLFTKFTENGQVEPDINFFGYGQKLNQTGSLKLTYFALVERAWAEGLVGVSYSPISWCELGIMGGIETIPSAYRGAASIYLTNKKISFSTCLEKGIGVDNWWYKSFILYSVNKKVSVGVMSWRFNVTGPYLEYFTNKGISFWTNFGTDFETKEKRAIVGLNIKI